MPSPQRRCNTCRHFQPAPLWRKGWCRNPLLYAAHQNHLVDERDLDCDRQFGDYWESIEAAEPVEAAPAPAAPAAPAAQAPAPTIQLGARPPLSPAPATPALRATSPATATVPPPSPALRRAPEPVTPARTRADTIRLAAPAIVVLLLLGGYALWTGLLLSTAASAVTPTVAVTATLPPATAVTGAAPTPTIAPTATVTPPPTSPPPTSTPAPPATPPPAGLQAGRAAIVDTGPDNANLRLRREPGSDGVIIRGIRNGERLTLVEGPRRVEAQEWWKIEYSGVTGWVAGAYLKPAE